MVTIATIVTSFLLKKLYSSYSDFNNSVLFAVATRKNYSNKYDRTMGPGTGGSLKGFSFV